MHVGAGAVGEQDRPVEVSPGAGPCILDAHLRIFGSPSRTGKQIGRFITFPSGFATFVTLVSDVKDP